MFLLSQKATQILREEFSKVFPDNICSSFYLSLCDELLTLWVERSTTTTTTTMTSKDQIIDRITVKGCKDSIKKIIVEPSSSNPFCLNLLIICSNYRIILIKIEDLSLSFISTKIIPNFIHISLNNDIVTTITNDGILLKQNFGNEIMENSLIRLQNSEDPSLLFEDSTMMDDNCLLILLENADILIFDVETLSLEGPLCQSPEPKPWGEFEKNKKKIFFNEGIISIIGKYQQFLRVDIFSFKNNNLLFIEGLLIRVLNKKEEDEEIIGICCSGFLVISNWRIIRIIMDSSITVFETIHVSMEAITSYQECFGEIILSTGVRVSILREESKESLRIESFYDKNNRKNIIPLLLLEREYVNFSIKSLKPKIEGEYPSSICESSLLIGLDFSQKILNHLSSLRLKINYLRKVIESLKNVNFSLTDWSNLAENSIDLEEYLVKIDLLIEKNDFLLKKSKRIYQIPFIMDSLKSKLLAVENGLMEMITTTTTTQTNNKEGLENLFSRLKVNLNK